MHANTSRFVTGLSLMMAAGFLTQDAVAQRGTFAISPDVGMTSDWFIDRGVTATSNTAGEVLAEMPVGLVVGVGSLDGTNCRIRGFQVNLQDQDASTQENFGVVVRARDPNQPGPDATQTLLRSGAFQTPASTGIRAWLFTLTLTTPANMPCDGYYYGAWMDPLPSTANDGLWAQMAHYNQGTRGDFPRTGAPKLGWSVDTTTNSVGSHDQVWSVALLADGPTLQVGANDPNTTRILTTLSHPTTSFGAAGFYPDVSGGARHDGLDVRVHDVGSPGALVGVLFAPALNPVPIPLGGPVQGALYLDPASMSAFAGPPIAASAPEQSILRFVPPGAVPTSLAGSGIRGYFQGVIVDVTNGIQTTNVVGVDF